LQVAAVVVISTAQAVALVDYFQQLRLLWLQKITQ
jgi:hypothetical protein